MELSTDDIAKVVNKHNGIYGGWRRSRILIEFPSTRTKALSRHQYLLKMCLSKRLKSALMRSERLRMNIALTFSVVTFLFSCLLRLRMVQMQYFNKLMSKINMSLLFLSLLCWKI